MTALVIFYFKIFTDIYKSLKAKIKLMKTVLTIFALFLILGCSNNDDIDFTVNFRFENGSSRKMENLIVNPMACAATDPGNYNYGTLTPNSLTDYHTFDYSAGLQSIKVTIEGKDYYFNQSVCDDKNRLGKGTYTVKLFTYEQNNEVVSLGVYAAHTD